MHNIKQLIRSRRSVRTYDGKPLYKSITDRLMSYASAIENPFDIPVEFRLLDAKEHGLVCPVVVGTDLYVGGKVKNVPNASTAFGYSFEKFVLYALSLDLGTVWLGGTMNRPAFEKAMELSEDEIMPCATPIGYISKKMSMRESIMRKTVKADERLPFEELFFIGSPATPLTREKAGKLYEPLEMVRLAPSAVNKQPWRVIVTDSTAHFYLKRSPGFSRSSTLDMQMVDVGIAMCHFALTAEENGLNIKSSQKDPDIPAPDMHYIASYEIV